jgi:hypothetical protein
VSNKEGALTIRGAGWNGCGLVRVSLPAPWGTASALLNAGAFVLEYPVPCGAEGGGELDHGRATVFAVQKKCHGKGVLRGEASILVPLR